MASSRLIVAVLVCLLVAVVCIRDEKIKEAGREQFTTQQFPNGIIPLETEQSLAILISAHLCQHYNAVAFAIAQACSLAKVELWVATSGDLKCVFDQSDILGPGFTLVYIEVPKLDNMIFVRDFAPTVTVDPETKRPVRTLSVNYTKDLPGHATAALSKFVHQRYNNTEQIHETSCCTEWGSLVTDGEGRCIISNRFDAGANVMAKWLNKIGVCSKIYKGSALDKTGHADITFAVAGPGQYLVSVPAEEQPLGDHAKAAMHNYEVASEIIKDREGGQGWGLHFTTLFISGKLEPSSYANALVVAGPGGTHLVFPTYDAVYLHPGDLHDPMNVNVMARNASKQSWIEALRAAHDLQDVNVIEVDASQLIGMEGSIHCATKNYPLPAR